MSTNGTQDMAARSKAVEEILAAQPASDGDGVRLLRVFGGAGNPARFDPFLMMDEFGSNESSDYIGGFPAHPHRGFETITYMLEGHMEHQDHMGNVGDLRNGDVQWMTAGAGVIHSEMPKQTEGRMRGFQVWLNLPARTKMQPADYRDISSASIPSLDRPALKGKLIAGRASINGEPVKGSVSRPDTHPLYLDLHFLHEQEPQRIELEADGYTALVYVYEGAASIGDPGTQVRRGHLARLQRPGDAIVIVPETQDTKVLVLAGKALDEPIVQYGPFVMNTREEIERALDDYRQGRLAVRE